MVWWKVGGNKMEKIIALCFFPIVRQEFVYFIYRPTINFIEHIFEPFIGVNIINPKKVIRKFLMAAIRENVDKTLSGNEFLFYKMSKIE